MYSASAPRGADRSLLGEYAATVADSALRERARQAEAVVRLQAEQATPIKSTCPEPSSAELRAALATVVDLAKRIGERQQHSLSTEEIAAHADAIQAAASHLLSTIENLVESR